MKLILDRKFITELSLAVSVSDAFTQKEEVIGKIKLTIPELNIESIENPSGYYNFFDLDHSTYTLKMESDFYVNTEVENFLLPRRISYNFPIGGGAFIGSTDTLLSDITGLLDRDVLEFNNGSDPPERRKIILDTDPSTNKIYWNKDYRGTLEYEYTPSSSITIPVPESMILNVKAFPNSLYPFPSSATLLRGSVRNTAGDRISEAEVQIVGGLLTTKTEELGDFVLFFPTSYIDSIIQISITPVGDPPKIVSTEIIKGRTNSLSVTYP